MLSELILQYFLPFLLEIFIRISRVRSYSACSHQFHLSSFSMLLVFSFKTGLITNYVAHSTLLCLHSTFDSCQLSASPSTTQHVNFHLIVALQCYCCLCNGYVYAIRTQLSEMKLLPIAHSQLAADI